MIYEEKAAVFTSAHYQGMSKDPGLLYLYAGLVPGRSPKDVEVLLREEVAKIRRGEFTHRELEKAKNQVKASFIYGMDSNFYRAMNMGRLEVLGVGWQYMQTYVDRIGAVSREDVVRVAQKYLGDTNLTVGILVPEGRP